MIAGTAELLQSAHEEYRKARRACNGKGGERKQVNAAYQRLKPPQPKAGTSRRGSAPSTKNAVGYPPPPGSLVRAFWVLKEAKREVFTSQRIRQPIQHAGKVGGSSKSPKPRTLNPKP